MQWSSAVSDSPSFTEAVTQASEQILANLDGKNPDLAVVFISSHHMSSYVVAPELLAETLGADITFAPDENTKKKVLDATNGVGADLVIESAGAVPAFAQAIDLVRSGGRVMPFGTYTAKEGEFSFYDLYFKEIEIINARAAKGQDFPTCIDLVKRGVINLAPLITHNLSLGDLGDALKMLKSGEGKQMKIVLDHS